MTTPDCEHLTRSFVSADEPDRLGRRTVRLHCDDCDAEINVMTTRTDAEIHSEIEARS